MTSSKFTKRALVSSALAILMCTAMLIGTTFAWFTDTASTGVNKIKAGTLKVDIVNKDGKSIKDESMSFRNVEGSDDILWEPGVTFKTDSFAVKNIGNLALKFKLILNGVTGDSELLDVIKFSVVKDDGSDNKTVVDLADFEGVLKANNEISDLYYIEGYMDEEAGNKYQDKSLEGLGITVVATQYTYEKDSIDEKYDAEATYPAVDQTELATLLNGGKSATLAKGLDPEKTITVNGAVKSTLDLDGKNIENTKDIWGDDDWSLVSAQGGANLTITGNGTFKAKENDCYAVDVQDGSTVTIKNGTFVGNIHAIYVHSGTAIIEGGFYRVQQKYPTASLADEFVLNCYDANRENNTAKIVVKGGTFVNFNPADCAAEGAHTNFVADGYKVVSKTQKNGDIWYTVVAE